MDRMESEVVNDSELVSLRVFNSEPEADIARGLLEAFGVDCFLARDDCGEQRPSLSFVEGLRLMVRAQDVSRAEEILAGRIVEEEG